MNLFDTGDIIGAINEDDQHHVRAVEVLATLPVAFVTTWPCVTEAMHLLRHTPAQAKLARMIEIQYLTLWDASQADAVRACALMAKYGDVPMDFADASLVVAAEVLGVNRILTFDRHFYAYRINGKTPFDVIS